MKKSLIVLSVFTLILFIAGCGFSKAPKELLTLYNEGATELEDATKMLKEAKNTSQAAKAIEKGSNADVKTRKGDAKIRKDNPLIPASDELNTAMARYEKAAIEMGKETGKVPNRFQRDKIIVDAINKAREAQESVQ